MKRTVLLIAPLALILLVAAMAAAQTPPSVPNLVNFQGRLTDNVGNPVADGAHSVHFYIFPVRTGGVSLWDELQNPTTTGGLFTTLLGSVNTLPLSLFQDYDSLFLEIVADAQLISPRTLLSASPLTRTADGLNGQSPYNPASSYIRTFPFGHQLSTFGADGLEQIRLWGPSWGEMYLYDSSPSNFLNFYATGDAFPGGSLYLGDGAGAYSLLLQGGIAGDASAVLPTDAIDSREILDEPGVSNSDKFGFMVLGTGAGTTYVLDSVDITIPASGYVEVTCNGYMNLNHTTGTNSSYFTTISKTRGDGAIYSGCAVARVPSTIATSGPWAFTMASSRMFVEGSPGTQRYYLMIHHESGTNLTSDGLDYYSFRAKYFSTLYGTTTLANSAVGANSVVTSASSSGLAPVSAPEVTTVTVADQNARLQAEYAKQISDLEARIKALEAKQTVVQQPGTVRPR